MRRSPFEILVPEAKSPVLLCGCKSCIATWEPALFTHFNEYESLTKYKNQKNYVNSVIVLKEHGTGGIVRNQTEHLALIEYPAP